jgi:hypothetical protein
MTTCSRGTRRLSLSRTNVTNAVSGAAYLAPDITTGSISRATAEEVTQRVVASHDTVLIGGGRLFMTGPARCS